MKNIKIDENIKMFLTIFFFPNKIFLRLYITITKPEKSVTNANEVNIEHAIKTEYSYLKLLINKLFKNNTIEQKKRNNESPEIILLLTTPENSKHICNPQKKETKSDIPITISEAAINVGQQDDKNMLITFIIK